MNASQNIFCSKVYSDAQIPQKGTPNSAGFDLYAFVTDPVTIVPQSRITVETGISIAFPKGWYGRIAPRSGLAFNYGIDVLAGVVDSDYRGQIKVILLNTGDTPFTIKHGDRIAQIIPEYCGFWTEMTVCDSLNDTGRGQGGFGSTGL
jgi:dUTP pyrophosphatase